MNFRRKKGSTNKKVRNATENIEDGIKFRSKLETYTYRRLREAGISSEYEAHRYNLVEKFAYTSPCYESHKIKGEKVFTEVSNNVRAITYTPDFVNTKDKWVIEVKGYANDTFPLKWKMFKNLMKDKGYTLYLPSTQKQVRDTIEIIKNMHYEEKIADSELTP